MSSNGPKPPGKKRGGHKVDLTARYRLFVTAYIRNGANGVAAARTAGYTGKPNVLAVTASKLLRRPEVKALLDERLAQAEEKIKAAGGEVMSDEEVLVRLTRQARSSLVPFVKFVTPEMAQAAIEACGDDKDRARNCLRLIEGRGFYLDIQTAINEGHGDYLSELVVGQDAAGFPETKIKVRDPHAPLQTLAKIKRLLSEKPAPPPPGGALVLGMVLGQMETRDLVRLRQEFVAAEQRAKANAIDVEAERV